MCRIIIGTSGYSYKDWIGPVYPEGTKQEQYLSFYTNKFKMVELNFSYYKQPEQTMLWRMINKTPGDFLFSIKAHRSLTHDRQNLSSSQWEENLKKFKQGIIPLIEENRLGAVLFQFPYSFHYTSGNRRYLDNLLVHFQNISAVVEFRGAEWQKESVLAGLKRRNCGYVNVDVPVLDRLPAPSASATSGIGYIRFHGRNDKNWWSGTNTTRYDYLYSQEEMVGWVPGISRIMKKVKLLLIAFNNHYKGQAVRNAAEFRGLLKEKGIKNVI